MRRRYGLGGLSEAELASTWLEQFRRWFAAAAESALVVEPNAMVLATASPDGVPDARNVLLKGFDAGGLRFFTNSASAKGRQLAANPRAAAVFSWLALERQVRFTGTVAVLPRAATEDYFASRPRGAQIGAWASEQSAVLDGGREELDAAVAQASARWPEGSRVTPPPHWHGYVINPDSVEFWQGRPDRLHDRLRYRSAPGGWMVERLAP
jgi:pyridoxamine 5'-phosphate oxidase